MLAIGLIYLLSLGLVMCPVDSGDDAADEDQQDLPQEDQNGDEGDLLNPSDPEETLGDDFNFIPAAGTDPEIVAEVNELLEILRDEPGLAAEDAVQQLNDLLNQLQAEAQADADNEDGETPDAEEELTRPPIGAAYIDPLSNPPLPVDPVAEEEEDEAEEEPVDPDAPLPDPIPPEELVTVTTNTGTEFADSVVLQEGPTSGENADRDYLVTASTVSNDINVGYDPQTTFLIDFSRQTETVTASLNSDIQGPDGDELRNESTQVDDNGNDYTFVSLNPSFTSTADIIMNVSDPMIGEHVARIDLTNSSDTLLFNFDADVTGNLHLVYSDAENGSGGDTSTTRTAYVIETPGDVDALSAADIQSLINGNNAQDMRLVAEVYLGVDSLTVDGDPDSTDPYTITVTNFINDNPDISSNIGWTSTGDDDGTTSTGNASGSGSGGSSGSVSDPDLGSDFDFPTLDLPIFGF